MASWLNLIKCHPQLSFQLDNIQWLEIKHLSTFVLSHLFLKFYILSGKLDTIVNCNIGLR